MKTWAVRVVSLARIHVLVPLCACIAAAADFPTDRGDYAAGFPTHFSNNRSDIVPLATGSIDRWTVQVGATQSGDAGWLSFTGNSMRLIATATASTTTSLRIRTRCRTRIVANWFSGHYANSNGTRSGSYIIRDAEDRIVETIVLAANSSTQSANGQINIIVEKAHSLEFVSATTGGSAALDLWNFFIREEDDLIAVSTPKITNADGVLLLEYSTDRRNNVYLLEESSDLATWSAVSNSTRFAATNSNTLTWSYPLLASARKVFFRVRLSNN